MSRLVRTAFIVLVLVVGPWSEGLETEEDDEDEDEQDERQGKLRGASPMRGAKTHCICAAGAFYCGVGAEDLENSTESESEFYGQEQRITD